jgi:hypothetical protein
MSPLIEKVRFAMDSPMEEAGFEPSVPRKKTTSSRLLFSPLPQLRSAEETDPLARNRRFESSLLQPGVRCKPDSRVRQCSTFLALPLPRGTEGSNPFSSAGESLQADFAAQEHELAAHRSDRLAVVPTKIGNGLELQVRAYLSATCIRHCAPLRAPVAGWTAPGSDSRRGNPRW